MVTLKEVAQIAQDHETAARNESWWKIANDLKAKPDMEVSLEALNKELEDQDFRSWWRSMRGVFGYKGVHLSAEIFQQPYTLRFRFPSVDVLRKSSWSDTKYKSPVQTKAESKLDTDDLYLKIQAAYKRYMVLKKREEKEQAEKAALADKKYA